MKDITTVYNSVTFEAMFPTWILKACRERVQKMAEKVDRMKLKFESYYRLQTWGKVLLESNLV